MFDLHAILGLGIVLSIVLFFVVLLLVKPGHFKREAILMSFLYIVFPLLFLLMAILAAKIRFTPR